VPVDGNFSDVSRVQKGSTVNLRGGRGERVGNSELHPESKKFLSQLVESGGGMSKRRGGTWETKGKKENLEKKLGGEKRSVNGMLKRNCRL